MLKDINYVIYFCQAEKSTWLTCITSSLKVPIGEITKWVVRLLWQKSIQVLGSITDACWILPVCLKQHSAKNDSILSHIPLGVVSLYKLFKHIFLCSLAILITSKLTLPQDLPKYIAFPTSLSFLLI